MTPGTFTFAELDKRIEKIPNAPGEMVLYPEGLTAFECIGILGTLMGLLPQLLLRIMTPEMWMVFVAKTGVALMVIGFCRALSTNVCVCLRRFGSGARILMPVPIMRLNSIAN